MSGEKSIDNTAIVNEYIAMLGEHLLRLGKFYAVQQGFSLATVSTYMGGSGDTLARLERGHDITTRRAARFAQWFSDHWPAGADWPSDIPRPPPTEKEAA